jgi:hypothetical protein
MLKKILSWSIVIIAFLMVFPLPLAIFVDMTYHWLLLITIPFGAPLLLILLIWRFFFLKEQKSDDEEK